MTYPEDDDFDRDETGSLTDEGRSQLVEWSQEHGLVDPPPEIDEVTGLAILDISDVTDDVPGMPDFL